MARGGYRVGAGRPKGSKVKSKSKKFQKGDISNNAQAENLTPLEYMLKIMRDPTEDLDRRARMAIAAAPFCHARKGEGLGKKEEKDNKAKEVGAGKFGSMTAKLKLVK